MVPCAKGFSGLERYEGSVINSVPDLCLRYRHYVVKQESGFGVPAAVANGLTPVLFLRFTSLVDMNHQI